MKRFRNIAVIGLLSCLAFYSCEAPSVSRPQGYYRIDLPTSEFSRVEVSCGVTLDKPNHSRLEIVESDKSGDACWFNLNFPRHNARLHITQVEIHDNLINLMEDAQEMVFSHDIKSNGISRIRIFEEENNTNGVLYHIGGPVATPIQFFVTDSSDHFIRGSLYFNHAPNPDSTAPVVAKMMGDIERVMRSISWK